MIPVTKTFFPPIEEYQNQLIPIWEKKWLTNRGSSVIKMESEIQNYLNSSPLIAMNNGTIPIQIALKILGKGGEIITTPFSYVATTSSIVWENCTPIFVDIEPNFLTIDPNKIEAAITEKTTCILATHVFGNACDIEAIQEIANRYNLKVIYDAAHCFGTRYNQNSIFNFGDISTCSFHATKIFHCGEGGALFSSNIDFFDKAFFMHNFGHNGQEDFSGVGINGKISELQGAMGLSVLPYLPFIIQERKKIVDAYQSQLNFIGFKSFELREKVEWNYAYYPIWFENEKTLKKVVQALNEEQIFPRRYFYPSLNKLPYVLPQHCPEAEKISTCIICLPLYVGLSQEEIEKIVHIIHAAI
jgi:dTDP-4-amino-4,6-dideoxygalactose transaminase